jgi:acetylornithine/succinyldiaminopimelate/putrescine aminotransferase
VVLAGNNVIRLLPPLNVTPEELAQSTEILRKVLISKA